MNKKSYKAITPTLGIDRKTVKIEPEPESNWVINANLTKAQFVEAYKLLGTGMKARRVALKFGIHKNKIRRIL